MEEPKSKSQKKRDAEFLQKIGVKLAALSPAKLDQIPLDEELKQAILEAKLIKSHGAMRRQAQLIGKLMRNADSEAILAAYEKLVAEDSAQTQIFHELELWRERLIQEDNHALTEFMQCFQVENVQQLRQLIKKAKVDQQQNKNTGASKALFRFLRTCHK